MRTIAFYSYKGGVGRSLLVANAARYLAMLGKKVLALDLDLEAPGLAYKFLLGSDSPSPPAGLGIVDILSIFLQTKKLPTSLSRYTIGPSNLDGYDNIRLMPAGNAPSAHYWRELANINWHDLLYSPAGKGTLFFLELRELISREFAPDFLLIDARTGITDIGGIATTLLPDTVVCLGLGSSEHLDGLRAAMRGIRQTTARQSARVELVPVISRLLNRKDSAAEQQEIERIRLFLNEPLSDGSEGLNFKELSVLHAEPTLDLQEQLFVGGKSSPHEIPLLRDYIRLFSLIIPPETLRHHVGELILAAVNRLLDDPDGTQSNLEALTTYCGDPEAYLALLKVYRVTKAPLEKSIRTASLMWQLRPSSASEALVQNIVEAAYSEPRSPEIQKQYVDFAEDVWRSSGMTNGRVGITIVNALGPEQRPRAIRLLLEYLEKVATPNAAVIVNLISLLRESGAIADALMVANRFKATAENASFATAWAKLALEKNDASQAKKILADPYFRIGAIRAEEPITAYRLLRLAGSEQALSVLAQALDSAMASRDMQSIRAVADIYFEEGRDREFMMVASERLPSSLFEEIQIERRSGLFRRRTAKYSN